MSQEVREEAINRSNETTEVGTEPVRGPVVIAEPTKGGGNPQPAKSGVPLRPLSMPSKSGKVGRLQRVIGVVRAMAPVAQKVLPLLEGNVALTLANFLAPRPQNHIDLEPIENAMTKMRKDHVDLRLSVADQNAALKRIADQVEAVKESAERNGNELKDLNKEVQQFKAKVNLLGWIGLGLLLVSILVNVLLFIQIRR